VKEKSDGKLRCIGIWKFTFMLLIRRHREIKPVEL
jgi:hypothetical protein